MDAPRLSLCMIVKDEAHFLPKCLESSHEFVDEIVVVDTGSTDDTAKIAAAYTNKVYAFDWQEDFAAARNFSLENAEGDWIIVLDADEVIEPDHWQRIRSLIAETKRDAFFLSERNYTYEAFEGGFLPVQVKTPYTKDFPGYKLHYIARLFRNIPSIRYRGHVHEVVDQSLGEDQFELSDIVIHHHGEQNEQRPKKERQLNYLRLMEKDLGSDPSGRLYATAASIRLHYLEDYPKAISYYDEAIRHGWQVQECRENQALAHYLSGNLDQAYSLYSGLLGDGYRTVNVCINFANIAVKRREFTLAADELEQAIQLGVVDTQTRIKIEHNIRYLREQDAAS